MISHFNYTNRQKIPHHRLRFIWQSGNDGVLSFTADLDLELPQPLPESASIFVEAYSGPVVMRFPFGTVGRITPPPDTSLTSFPPGLKPNLRVKVVDTSDSNQRLLAWAKNISPQSPEDAKAGKRSILPVESVDLGPLIWNIRLEENLPVLQVNSLIREPRDITSLAKDADFISLVYPAAIHRILSHLLLGPDHDSIDRDHDWLLFGASLAGRVAPDPDKFEDDSPEYREEVEDWILDAMKGFCMKNAAVECYVQFRKEAEEHHA